MTKPAQTRCSAASRASSVTGRQSEAVGWIAAGRGWGSGMGVSSERHEAGRPCAVGMSGRAVVMRSGGWCSNTTGPGGRRPEVWRTPCGG
ncbi:hypothetical protein SBRY_50091 [Actinacidiphila bryophytorum]|uniref:Uncharacterized protein n=1 Tax=Actinacidiphila bryophytorum TaxID=1436133 RepID=A0A9W4H422_9ACTN|nr:hypothetical protein SBRY_50091 [Actinacidiphila bryophytorum]